MSSPCLYIIHKGRGYSQGTEYSPVFAFQHYENKTTKNKEKSSHLLSTLMSLVFAMLIHLYTGEKAEVHIT